MSNQLVSYVVNTFNRPLGLIQAVNSILAQDYEHIEIVVVDDCSEKQVPMHVFAGVAVDIRYLKNEVNLGLSRSREVGLRAASSDIVCFLDDDDFLIDKSKTARQLNIINSDKKIAVVCSNVSKIYQNGRVENISISWPLGDRLRKHFYTRNGIIFPSTTMIRRQAFLDVGGFDFRFRRGVDSDVYRRLLMFNYEFRFEEHFTVCYLAEAEDKITDNKSIGGIKNDIHSNFLTLKKYWKGFVFQPAAALFRVNLIFRGLIKLVLRCLRAKC